MDSTFVIYGKLGFSRNVSSFCVRWRLNKMKIQACSIDLYKKSRKIKVSFCDSKAMWNGPKKLQTRFREPKRATDREIICFWRKVPREFSNSGKVCADLGGVGGVSFWTSTLSGEVLGAPFGWSGVRCFRCVPLAAAISIRRFFWTFLGFLGENSRQNLRSFSKNESGVLFIYFKGKTVNKAKLFF